MDTIQIIQIILTGIGAGLFAGMFGIGGGIVILPVLIVAMKWDVYLAVGTSLGALLLPTNFGALNNYRKRGFLFIKGSLLVAIGMILGNYLGATFALEVGGILVKILFGIYQVFIGIRYIKPKQIFKKILKKEIILEKEPIYNDVENIRFYVFLIGGICAGILAGMFGIGGGLIITILLINAYKISPKQAVAISLAAMFLPTGIAGTIIYYNADYVNVTAAILIAVGIELGSNISSRVALKMEQEVFKQIFGVFLFVLGWYFIVESFIKF